MYTTSLIESLNLIFYFFDFFATFFNGTENIIENSDTLLYAATPYGTYLNSRSRDRVIRTESNEAVAGNDTPDTLSQDELSSLEATSENSILSTPELTPDNSSIGSTHQEKIENNIESKINATEPESLAEGSSNTNLENTTSPLPENNSENGYVNSVVSDRGENSNLPQTSNPEPENLGVNHPSIENSLENLYLNDNSLEDLYLNEDPIENTNLNENPLENTNLNENPLENTNLNENPLENTSLNENPLQNTNLNEDFLQNTNLNENPLENTSLIEDPLLNPTTFLSESTVEIGSVNPVLPEQTEDAPIPQPSTTEPESLEHPASSDIIIEEMSSTINREPQRVADMSTQVNSTRSPDQDETGYREDTNNLSSNNTNPVNNDSSVIEDSEDFKDFCKTAAKTILDYITDCF